MMAARRKEQHPLDPVVARRCFELAVAEDLNAGARDGVEEFEVARSRLEGVDADILRLVKAARATRETVGSSLGPVYPGVARWMLDDALRPGPRPLLLPDLRARLPSGTGSSGALNQASAVVAMLDLAIACLEEGRAGAKRLAESQPGAVEVALTTLAGPGRRRGRPSRAGDFVRHMFTADPSFTTELRAWLQLDDELHFLPRKERSRAMKKLLRSRGGPKRTHVE
jgi:hypothetical protein